MDKLVADSSVWIDFFNKKTTSQIETIKDLIVSEVVVSRITILPTILQEVLQGINNNKYYEVVKDNLYGFNFLVYDSYNASVNAADLFRYLQKKGVTIRKSNDCLIASLCIENDLSLLHKDRDFDNIAKHTSLKIYK